MVKANLYVCPQGSLQSEFRRTIICSHKEDSLCFSSSPHSGMEYCIKRLAPGLDKHTYKLEIKKRGPNIYKIYLYTKQEIKHVWNLPQCKGVCGNIVTLLLNPPRIDKREASSCFWLEHTEKTSGRQWHDIVMWAFMPNVPIKRPLFFVFFLL